MSEYVKPFTMGYVLRVTAKNIRKHIDVSIRKTSQRIGEFAEEEGLSPEENSIRQEKSREIFQTLAELHAWRNNLDAYQAENSSKFKGE